MTIYRGGRLLELLLTDDPEDSSVATEFDALIHGHMLENWSPEGPGSDLGTRERQAEGATVM